MAQIAGQPIERFTPHDFRRTTRSNTKRLNVDFDTAEAMLNHVKTGLERTYDRYDLEDEKRVAFLRWEEEVAAIADQKGVAGLLGLHSARAPASITSSTVTQSPQGPALQPAFHLGAAETGATPMLARTAAKLVFTWKPGRSPFSQTINLTPRQSSEQGEFISSDEFPPRGCPEGMRFRR